MRKLKNWWEKFRATVDDLVLRSNVHNCGKNQSTNEKAPKKDRPTCINKQGKCKARYPRELFEQTQVDPQTGALNMKKGEAWINTFTPLVTYLLRCNTDVTSLLSGTAIKAIVAYISDYVTKPSLKTYTVFDTIRGIFDRNSEMLSSSLDRKEKARRLMCQIVNSLTAKMEIGGPLASMYLLGNPDHYTNLVSGPLLCTACTIPCPSYIYISTATCCITVKRHLYLVSGLLLHMAHTSPHCHSIYFKISL